MKISPNNKSLFVQRKKTSLKRFKPIPGTVTFREGSFSGVKKGVSEQLKELLLQQVAVQRRMQVYAGKSGVIKGIHDSHNAAIRGIKGA
jgi:hypothetical protein